MAKSLIGNDKICVRCGTTLNIEKHHILNGTAYRKKAEEDGLWMYLCHDCHQYVHSVNNMLLREYKKLAELIFIQNGGSVEKFVERYGKNYL